MITCRCSSWTRPGRVDTSDIGRQEASTTPAFATSTSRSPHRTHREWLNADGLPGFKGAAHPTSASVGSILPRDIASQ